MNFGLIAFLLFLVAFIARAINSGLELGDYVLWMLLGLMATQLSPVAAIIPARRQPARNEP